MMTSIKDARSRIDSSNLQEFIDASSNIHTALDKGQAQYQTPDWLARAFVGLLPFRSVVDALDPQCASGALLKAVRPVESYGIELDNRFARKQQEEAASGPSIRRITANCVKVGELFAEVCPDIQFSCIVANPPFGLRWRQSNDKDIDATEWTWKFINQYLAKNGIGFMIGNAPTLERLGIPEHEMVYLYQRFPAGGIWENCNVELGVVHYHKTGRKHTRVDRTWDRVPRDTDLAALGVTISYDFFCKPYVPAREQMDLWGRAARIIEEERKEQPPWNIYLAKDGTLRTYLSTRKSLKLGDEEVAKLARINRCHPLTLTTEKEQRVLMKSLVDAGHYTIEPAALVAIDSALREVASLACPILPVTDFELVAYADEEDSLLAKAGIEDIAKAENIAVTPGKRYELNTGTYKFTQNFYRKKVHFKEETGETTIEDHECRLSGSDRYIQITDDKGAIHRFMDRPPEDAPWCHHESLVWKLFKEPYVPTVAELQSDQYERNIEIMHMNEMIAGYKYFPGQLDYYARMGCKDYGLIAADVGTGKTLGALTMVSLKSPKRCLIIAPQGTMRSSGDEGDTDYQASQWVQEIRRFAPTEPVFQLFDRQDWRNILRANGGELPNGIYISYPQAYFSNGSFEHIPSTWEDKAEEKFCKMFNLQFVDGETEYHDGVGSTSDKGIRCVATPSLATEMAIVHGEDLWEMIQIDEAHLCCNIDAKITKNLLRVQPKYRYALTATPIPNIVSNIFSLMGWLCVKDWHMGGQRNAAWPYAVDEIGRFNSTFLSTEEDITAQQMAKAAGKRGWSKAGTKSSPVISAPARLLKLLRPTMAYISKENCNPDLNPCQVIDVRVAMGKEQAKLYGYWLDRGHYYPEFKSPLTIAQVQSSRLRGICASPASLDYTRGMCRSNFNPKTVTILQLIRDCLAKGEQVVVVSARVNQSDAVAERLSDAGIPIARIDSTIAPELHVAEANRFKRGDARVMLMGIKCAQGHSFDKCPNLIIGSLEWSYGTLHQAKGRVWRLTSPKPVKVWCVLHQNTIEELLFDRVAVKQDAATLCLHGRRVPRDFQTMDASEILAEHIVNYDAGDGEILSETECETQWVALRKQLVLANHNNFSEARAVA